MTLLWLVFLLVAVCAGVMTFRPAGWGRVMAFLAAASAMLALWGERLMGFLP